MLEFLDLEGSEILLGKEHCDSPSTESSLSGNYNFQSMCAKVNLKLAHRIHEKKYVFCKHSRFTHTENQELLPEL